MNKNKNKDFLKKRYIYLIIIGVLSFSLVSWVYFVKDMVGITKSHLNQSQQFDTNTSDNKNTITLNNNLEINEDIDTNINDKIVSFCNSFNNVINIIDARWNVYRQSDFSKIDTIITYFETGEIASSQVISGTNGWLFYSSKNDGDPIGDYEGTNSFSNSELSKMYKSALKVQSEIENRGIKFAILVAPNKENIYSEYMPNVYSHKNLSRTDVMINYLSNNGINIVSPKIEMLNNIDKFKLYYSYDTHWNQLGAYIGAQEVLKTWNIGMSNLTERNIITSNLKDKYHYCAEDDLAQMLGMRSVYNDEIEYVIDGTKSIDWLKFKEEQNNSIISHFYNDNAKKNEIIFIIGDSFRSSLIPSISEQFSDVYVVHRSYFTSNMIDKIKPNYVIFEYVERYSEEIKKIANFFN